MWVYRGEPIVTPSPTMTKICESWWVISVMQLQVISMRIFHLSRTAMLKCAVLLV